MERHGPRGGGKRVAFTLAEVLITLGIIGVVAAITLPTLIKNYQKQVYVTQLKKVVNMLENNSRKILADEGVDSLQDTPLYSPDLDDKRSFKLNKDYFEKHYKLTPLSETTEYAIMIKSIFDDVGFTTDNYYSNDGACITTLNGQSSILYYDHFSIIVDINCAKRPNKVGYDRFVILFNDNNGSLYTEENANMCTSYIDYEDEDEDIEALKLILGGYFCFCKIVQDGWKMNY